MHTGDYVVVHVGFAISRIDEEEAHKVFQYLKEMDELGELDVPQPGEEAQPGDQTTASGVGRVTAAAEPREDPS